MLTHVTILTGQIESGPGVQDLTHNTYAVTICENGSYCCGNGTVADVCCRLKQGFFVANGSAVQQNPI